MFIKLIFPKSIIIIQFSICPGKKKLFLTYSSMKAVAIKTSLGSALYYKCYKGMALQGD
jgi:hypothetical protein